MKIHKKTEFFQDCRQIISMVQKDHPATLPLILATAFLDASFPFINLIFGALILDHLLAGDKNTMFLVWWMISLNCILGIGSRFLSWRARAEGLVVRVFREIQSGHAQTLFIGGIVIKWIFIPNDSGTNHGIMVRESLCHPKGQGISSGGDGDGFRIAAVQIQITAE